MVFVLMTTHSAQLDIIIEQTTAQLNLFAWLESWHTQVRTRGTPESITQVTLKKKHEKYEYIVQLYASM